jgi:hypothetical protein
MPNHIYQLQDYSTSRECGIWTQPDDKAEVKPAGSLFTDFVKLNVDHSEPDDDVYFYHKGSTLLHGASF